MELETVISLFEPLAVLFTFVLLIPLVRLFLSSKLGRSIYFLRAVNCSRSGTFIVMLVYCTFMTFYLFGGNLRANWGMIDDHEIINFIGQQDRLMPGDYLPTLVMGTEIGNPGGFFQGYPVTYSRFRPIYYILRLFEAMVWGKNVVLWYGCRLLLFGLTLFILTNILKPYLGIFGSITFNSLILTMPFWADIFGRLGPSETYAAPAFVLFIWGAVRLLDPITQEKQITKYYAAMFGGAVLCFGSKENFVVLLLPLIAIVVYLIVHRSWRIPYLWFVSAVLFGFYICFVLWQRLSLTAFDVYQQPVSLKSRIAHFLMLFSRPDYVGRQLELLIVLAFGAVLPLWYVFIRLRSRRQGLEKYVLLNLLGTMTILGLYISQMVFYNFDWPTWSRYDFPGMLSVTAFILLQYWFISNILSLQKQISFEGAKLAFIFSTLIVLLIKGYDPVISRVKQNAELSSNFSANMARVVEASRAYPDLAYLLSIEDIHDYEKVFSLERYLRASNVRNTIFLDVSIDPLSLDSELKEQLYDEIMSMSERGDGRSIAPIGSLVLHENVKYASLSFSEITGVELTSCDEP